MSLKIEVELASRSREGECLTRCERVFPTGRCGLLRGFLPYSLPLIGKIGRGLLLSNIPWIHFTLMQSVPSHNLNLDADVFMETPEGHRELSGQVVRLNESFRDSK